MAIKYLILNANKDMFKLEMLLNMTKFQGPFLPVMLSSLFNLATE